MGIIARVSVIVSAHNTAVSSWQITLSVSNTETKTRNGDICLITILNRWDGKDSTKCVYLTLMFTIFYSICEINMSTPLPSRPTSPTSPLFSSPSHHHPEETLSTTLHLHPVLPVPPTSMSSVGYYHHNHHIQSAIVNYRSPLLTNAILISRCHRLICSIIFIIRGPISGE